MLMSLGIELPKKVYGHGWLIVDGEKMSKSKGNVIDPIPLLREFGSDAIRYYLLNDIQLGQDGNFSRDRLISRINSDLSNDLGNLLYRTLSMAAKYNGGVLRKGDASSTPSLPKHPKKWKTMRKPPFPLSGAAWTTGRLTTPSAPYGPISAP